MVTTALKVRKPADTLTAFVYQGLEARREPLLKLRKDSHALLAPYLHNVSQRPQMEVLYLWIHYPSPPPFGSLPWPT